MLAFKTLNIGINLVTFTNGNIQYLKYEHKNYFFCEVILQQINRYDKHTPLLWLNAYLHSHSQ